MTIEIIKGDNNAVTDFFSSPSNTPETDDQPIFYAMNDNGYQVLCVDLEFARKLERERDEARKHLKEIEEYGTDEINAAVDLRRNLAQALVDLDDMQYQRDEAREQIKELIYISERAIDLAEIDFENDKFGIVSELRYELKKIMQEGAK
jgi:hypothetical protein